VVVGIGVDVVDVARFTTAVQRTPALAQATLTPPERELRPEQQAARFAAKEALAKALGAPKGLAWHDAEVVVDDAGRPGWRLRGTVASAVAAAGASVAHLSLSHDGGLAVAMVVLEG
jgi:holo-[acyl-carrier protein] synthase